MVKVATDCLIIGAGPAGLTLGIALIRAGMTVLIVEKHETRLPFSKALLVNSKSLSELKGLINIHDLMESATAANGITVHLGTMVSASAFFDTNNQTPYHPVTLPQGATEDNLTQISLSRGGQILRGYTFDPALNVLGHYRNDIPPEIRLTSCAAPVTVQCSWLFGCDGAHSSVRQALHLDFKGSTDRDQLYVMDAVVDEWTLPTHFFLSIKCAGAQAAIQVRADPTTVRVVGNSRNSCLVMLRYFAVRSVLWDGSFTNSYRLASSYGRGRVWLVGDACHVHSPIGGRGMNIGMQEAVALARAIEAWDVKGQYEALCREAAKDWVFWNYYLTQLMLGGTPLWCALRAVLIAVLAVLVRILGEGFMKRLFEKVAAVKVHLLDRK
jgi:2-polyprenyl-6-methoxyphenol hydroxylase-like FAD-dependent oxidoreductase